MPASLKCGAETAIFRGDYFCMKCKFYIQERVRSANKDVCQSCGTTTINYEGVSMRCACIDVVEPEKKAEESANTQQPI